MSKYKTLNKFDQHKMIDVLRSELNPGTFEKIQTLDIDKWLDQGDMEEHLFNVAAYMQEPDPLIVQGWSKEFKEDMIALTQLQNRYGASHVRIVKM
jgi:hypothetical protein